jgi:hypothetical protein
MADRDMAARDNRFIGLFLVAFAIVMVFIFIVTIL